MSELDKLRDHFAAKVLEGEIACQHKGYSWNLFDSELKRDELAKFCYRMADAMLKARET